MPNITNFTDIGNTDSVIFFEDKFLILVKFIYHIWVSIAIFGITANIINIIVFVKIRPKDNVTITLLALSISDLINLFINAPRIAGRFIEWNLPNHNWPFEFYIVVLGPYWYAQVFYDYSSFISVFLAAVRCACVASPLRFKSTFTKSRTITILCLLFLLAMILRIPVLTVFSLTWALNPRTNSTYRALKFSDNFREIYRANDILNRNIISWITYVAVVTCVSILASKLQAASEFRQSLSSARKPEKGKMVVEIPRSVDPQLAVASKNSSEKMSTKDLQVIQSVALICVIFIFSQLPSQLISTVRLLVPEFANFRSGEAIYGFMSHISITSAYLNVSINIFIHARFNSRYRQTFLGLFSKKL